VEPYNEFIPVIIAAHSSDPFAVDVLAKHVNRPMIDSTDTAKDMSQWAVVMGVLTHDGRIDVLGIDSLCTNEISLLFDIPASSHFGAPKNTELVSRDFCWPVMDSHLSNYVSGCDVCYRIKSPRHARYGINMPWEAPSRPWEDITIDFMTNIPKSMA
jgi:hypothetical protein